MPSEMIIKNGERSQCERFHRYPFLTAPEQERNDAMPGATLAADTEESNSEDEAVDGQDGQDGHVADTGHEVEHGSRDGHSQTDGEGYTEFSGVSPTSAMYEDDFSQVSPDSGALSPSSPSSPLSPGDAAADMALAAVGTTRGDATEPSQRSPASPASPALVSASEAPETPGAEAPEASEATEASEASEYGDDFEDRAQDAQVNALVAEKDRTAACCRLQPFSPFVWRRNHAIVPFFGMFRVKEVGHERFGLKASVSPRFLCFGRCSIANSRHLTAHLPARSKTELQSELDPKMVGFLSLDYNLTNFLQPVFFLPTFLAKPNPGSGKRSGSTWGQSLLGILTPAVGLYWSVDMFSYAAFNVYSLTCTQKMWQGRQQQMYYDHWPLSPAPNLETNILRAGYGRCFGP